MNYRMYALSALAAALIAGDAFADETKNATHKGKLVSITQNKLVLTGEDNKEHSHTLTSDAKLTLDGKAVQAADLKPGTRIRVTTQEGDKSTVNRVEGLGKNRDFAGNTRDGQIVRVTDKQLVFMEKRGQKEQTSTLTNDVKITCDGRVCKASELKPGMKVRVSSENDSPNTITRVEALDKNQDFASL
ncbi:MAG: hypothetical protein EA381_19885 [Planctomycetaceae bacterium]|nr:MAG: hypothetical protein EA381_19885 [Planctomycetaceae bacterium]